MIARSKPWPDAQSTACMRWEASRSPEFAIRCRRSRVPHSSLGYLTRNEFVLKKKAAAPHLRYWGLRAPARYTRGSNCRKQIGTDLQLTERIRAGQWNFGTEVAFDYG